MYLNLCVLCVLKRSGRFILNLKGEDGFGDFLEWGADGSIPFDYERCERHERVVWMAGVNVERPILNLDSGWEMIFHVLRLP